MARVGGATQTQRNADGGGSLGRRGPSQLLGEYEPLVPRVHKERQVTVFGYPVRNALIIFMVGFGSVAGLAGQSISLPLYLSALENAGGPYFVLWLCGLAFTVIFGVWSACLAIAQSGNIHPSMLRLKWHPLMLAVGLADALNGVFIVYSSNVERVPGPTQAVLGLTALPFTLVFSKILLRRVYNARQLLGAGFVFAGLVLIVAPQLHLAATGDASFSSAVAWWWPLIYLLGQVPGALMNVLQEKLQFDFRLAAKAAQLAPSDREFSAIYFQFVESFYQWVFLCAFFFFDLIPNFGISHNLDDFAASFRSGWKCFMNSGDETMTEYSDRCAYAGGLGTLFIAAYVVTYVFSTLATRHASANLLATATSTLPAVIALLFWLLAPAANTWAGGSSPSAWEIGFNVGSLALSVPGMCIYYYFTKPDPHGAATIHSIGRPPALTATGTLNSDPDSAVGLPDSEAEDDTTASLELCCPNPRNLCCPRRLV